MLENILIDYFELPEDWNDDYSKEAENWNIAYYKLISLIYKLGELNVIKDIVPVIREIEKINSEEE